MNKKQKRTKFKNELKRIIQYSIAGGAWFWSGYLMFAFCDIVLGLNLWWSKLFANIFGLTINFIIQRIWVFDDTRKHRRLTIATERYTILTLANFIIDYFIVLIARDVFGITPYIGQFISAGFMYGWNYMWYKLWVFAGYNKKSKKA